VPGDPRIRASDADRDRAAALLREHHAAGRLTAEEFHERLDAALNAKTLGEIDDLLADLPVIDLYRLPHESMQRPAGLPHTSIRPRDPGGGTTARFQPGTVAMGAWAAATGTLIAVWAVTAVVGIGTWIPWWLLVVVVSWAWIATRRYRRHRE
jgi:Domain of unknown function (DUF1707)